MQDERDQEQIPVEDEQEQPEQSARQPAPMIEPPKPRMATVDDLRTTGHIFEHEIPGGLIVRMRALAMHEFVESGALPSDLLGAVIETVEAHGGRMPTLQQMDTDEKRDWLRVLRSAACCAAVEPRIVATEAEAEQDPAAVWVGSIDDGVVYSIGGAAITERRRKTDPFVRSSPSEATH